MTFRLINLSTVTLQITNITIRPNNYVFLNEKNFYKSYGEINIKSEIGNCVITRESNKRQIKNSGKLIAVENGSREIIIKELSSHAN